MKLTEDTRYCWISNQDLERSVTAKTPGVVIGLLESNSHEEFHRLLDIGCGYGGLPKTIADHFSISEVHGVDVDPQVLEEAKSKGITVHCLDVDQDVLPYPDGPFDLLTCFGMLDGLPYFDFAIGEMFKVLRPGGHIVVSMPNLASWSNRLTLLLGYKLRDVEISRNVPVTSLSWFRKNTPVQRHIHTATPLAFRDFMSSSGFNTVKIIGARPTPWLLPWPLRLADRLLSKRAGLARRFFYLGTKT